MGTALDSNSLPISPDPGRLSRTAGDFTHMVQVLTLLLALSGALKIAFPVGIIARHVGTGPAQAVLTAVGTAGTVMAIFFAAVTAYHWQQRRTIAVFWDRRFRLRQPPSACTRLGRYPPGPARLLFR
jgi:hypothetical protein